MPDEPILPVNFTISPAAWDEIEVIRDLYDRESDDKADVLTIGWGTTFLYNGRSWSHVVVGFYRQSERHKIEHGIQFISGREVIFFTVPKHHHRFEGKIVDFEPGRGVFLANDQRAPKP